MDLEKFIRECERYFRVTDIAEAQRNLFVICFLNKELIEVYEKVDSKIDNYKDRLRKAFDRPASLVQDWTELMEHKKEDCAEVYFIKVVNLVGKVLRHKLDKEELVKYFLVHCLGEVDTKREIKIRKAVEKEEKEEIIKNIDRVNEINGQVMALGRMIRR